jgi:hypothetical protein
VISDHKDSAAKEFILPFEECFEDGDHLHLEHMIVHLHHSELL